MAWLRQQSTRGGQRTAGLPTVAQVAIQGGRHVARQITARLAGRLHGQAFEYHDKGSMDTISRFSAVASIGRLRLSGFTAWLMWLAVHLFYLIGFKNRLTTLSHWAVSFVGRRRSERTVTQEQIFARQALDQLGEEFSPSCLGGPGRILSPEWSLGPTSAPTVAVRVVA